MKFYISAMAFLFACSLGGCGDKETGTDTPNPVVDNLLPDPPESSLVSNQAREERPKTTNLTPEGFHRTFRKEFPFHVQSLILSGGSDHRILVVSEPPPDVSLKDLKAILGEDVKVIKHGIGVDGWVKDVVVKVPFEDDVLQPIINRLSATLYGSDYKAYVVELPREKPDRKDYDLQVNGAEIKDWILDNPNTFVKLGETGGKPLASYTSQSDSAVLYSQAPGLVAWWIPKSKPVSQLKAQHRQFAIDSDLIVGGLAIAEGIFVVGRERQVDLDELPPLRFETVSMLAGTKNEHLAQSYERNNPLAGRINRTDDWAPILLSEELVNTEYGSLLNITDQMLKGWSSGGLVDYDNFPVDKPKKLPFGGQPLISKLKLTQLQFNWNTAGAGYDIEDEGRAVFALHRAGALPISYLPNSQRSEAPAVFKAEDEAYDWYAGIDHPDLARVVQYAGLYQLFRNHPDSLQPFEVPKTPDPRKRLADATATMLKKVSKNSLYRELFPTLATLVKGKTPQQLKALARSIAIYGPESKKAFGAKPDLCAEELKFCAQFEQIWKKYVAATASEEGWLHTPAIVRSTPRGALENLTGGHNLDSNILRFRLTDDINAPLEPGVLPIPKDKASIVGKLNKMLAKEGRYSREELELKYITMMAGSGAPPRKPPVALKLATGGAGGGSRGPGGKGWGAKFPGDEPPNGGSGGRSGGPRKFGRILGGDEEAIFLAYAKRRLAIEPDGIIVRKTHNGYEIYELDSQVTRLRTPQDAIDFVAAKHQSKTNGPTEISLVDMDIAESKTFIDQVGRRSAKETGFVARIEKGGKGGTRFDSAIPRNATPSFATRVSIRDKRYRVAVEARIETTKGLAVVDAELGLRAGAIESQADALSAAALRAVQGSSGTLVEAGTVKGFAARYLQQLKKLKAEHPQEIVDIHQTLDHQGQSRYMVDKEAINKGRRPVA